MKEKPASDQSTQSYVKNIFRITLLAGISIFLAVVITGFFGYSSTKNSMIQKAKSQDIVFIVKSMASKIEGRIGKAIETSKIMAQDPVNIQWLKEAEQDAAMGRLTLDKLHHIVGGYDYNSIFIASAKTKHYYYEEASSEAEKRGSYVVLSQNNPADQWFYNALEAKKPLVLNVDYDRAMDDTFLFVNAAMGEIEAPVGICGVGLSLHDIAKEFRTFKVGKQSKLWMLDEKGMIQLSDDSEDIGRNFGDYIPQKVVEEIQRQSLAEADTIQVSQFKDSSNRIIDYAYCKISASDWVIFYEIPRSESLSLLGSLRINMTITVVLVLIFFMILFYITSKKIADPYKQAILMNMELEAKVDARTQELKESNQKIMDSIEYAKRLQESILPTERELKRVFEQSFVIWRPRDVVGGDFLWMREINDITVLAVGDCTGHGVPGALMTMTVNALLHHIVTAVHHNDPAVILKELHRELRETLNKTSNEHSVDDGLDIAICCIENKDILRYAGASIDLYVKRGKDVRILKSQCKGVGYGFIQIPENIRVEEISIQAGDCFIAATDGFVHQNGGEKNYPFGKQRLLELIQGCSAGNPEEMKKQFEEALDGYMKGAAQRDDITLTAFQIK